MQKIDLEKYLPKLKPYTELRQQENRFMSIQLVNGNLVKNEKRITSGVSARTFKNGYWGFASNPVVNNETIDEVLNIAKKNADFLASKGDLNLPMHEGKTIAESHDYSTKKKRLSQNQLIEFLNQVDKYIFEKYPNLTSRAIILACVDMEKNLITSHGTTSYLNWPRTNIYIEMTMTNDDGPNSMLESFGGFGHFEDVFESIEDLKSGIDTLYTELSAKNNGIIPTAGTHEVILDASLAGILAHEALGHTVEADFVRIGSIAGDYLNEKVASELITLVDFANSYNGKILPCPIFIDDEGVESKDAWIIKDGILGSYLHNRDSALEFSMENTGNARAWDYSDEPLIRMRNTCILPGSSKLEEMIASIEDGYYFTKTNNGQADSTGEFMFAVTCGYEIKNGKLGRAIKDTTISGKAFDVLASVSMVSDDMKWTPGGFCGKKQMIPTAMGGPAIKCKINVGGQ
ncbi:TldD/PmbA family protein [Clostridiaceae bacterium M8S5]|nr:TldD/PmbA family protein [Clostridiaceae bacterium M8S5]